MVNLLLLLTFCSCKDTRLQEPFFNMAGKIDEKLLRSFVDAPDNFEKVVVKSQGGDVIAAIEIAKIIKKRNLDVEVNGYCLSACAQYILPSARNIIIRDKSIVALHHSPFSIMKMLEFSKIYDESEKYKKVSNEEVKFYNEININIDYIKNSIYHLRPKCLTNINLKGFKGIKFYYQFYIPKKNEYEYWLGKKINGFWPKDGGELLEAINSSIPKGVNTSFAYKKNPKVSYKISYC